MRQEEIGYRTRRTWLDEETTVSDDPRRVPKAKRDCNKDKVLVLRGGRVWKANGEPGAPGTLVIRGNRIEAVLPAGSTAWPDDATVLDVAGHTVMPGLIDAHTHISYTEPGVPMDQTLSMSDCTLRAIERLRFWAESGITSVRDAGSHGDVPFRLKAWVGQNRLPLPRVFPCGQLITGTGGHAAEQLSPLAPGYGQIREASGPDGWREAVREQFKAGADVIKVASHFSREEIAAAVDEAHTLGLKVMCDAETFYIQWAVEAGVDTVEHPLPRTDETIRLMAERGTQSVPTLVPYMIIFDLWGGYFGSTSRRFAFSKEANFDVLCRMRRAGVTIGIGTDIVMDWFRYMPEAYLRELQLLVAAGASNTEALEAATRVNAAILDMDHLLGTLEPGKLADVLVVGGDPEANLDNLLKVNLVIRDGHLIVKGGQIYVEPHVGRPMPKPSGLSKGPWY